MCVYDGCVLLCRARISLPKEEHERDVVGPAIQRSAGAPLAFAGLLFVYGVSPILRVVNRHVRHPRNSAPLNQFLPHRYSSCAGADFLTKQKTAPHSAAL